ncbi:hypothetical protein TIFTF001_039453 [Ficus carica]|uniref:Uncharacterized protein n=1 Tax=Ficus carica TaxID=3494 RepID=A0AA88EF44_FICCA|nr:hypothetical protein TIFTF001_039453 [Ficus carica]
MELSYALEVMMLSDRKSDSGKGRIRSPGGLTRFSLPENDGFVILRAAPGDQLRPLVAAGLLSSLFLRIGYLSLHPLLQSFVWGARLT